LVDYFVSSQATLAPPVSGKMFKGLLICYAVVISTFFSVAGAGYWAFGNASVGNIFTNFAPSGGVALIPNWLLFLANMFVIAELFAVALVAPQVSKVASSLCAICSHGS
jgi:hypothetical protein